ncbi:hypothetical protein [Massilia psychrophila]|jgi:hypothetical protein|uniref:Uncharacterized protein n=1 Tax=Massilia psychrophila TaxID=1603353 RepID=A0A2G8T2Z3_9BURK|nr:hypothetical protein [Massilia psychrophila]PIL40384.1 hypothetical protein CR103_08195 [Massilia psychrophila]GGE78361.1 hypothetical protein GCM10008020_23870 [Massilia psychrophila]
MSELTPATDKAAIAAVCKGHHGLHPELEAPIMLAPSRQLGPGGAAPSPWFDEARLRLVASTVGSLRQSL